MKTFTVSCYVIGEFIDNKTFIHYSDATDYANSLMDVYNKKPGVFISVNDSDGNTIWSYKLAAKETNLC